MIKICIVIPAYREENRIGRTLEHYCNYFQALKAQGVLDFELLVVSNGRQDNTLGVVQDAAKKWPEILAIELLESGKGLAITHGFRDALTRPNDLIGFVDADMATSPEYFYELVKEIGTHDGIIASRYMKGATVTPARPAIKYWGRRLVYDNLVYLLFQLSNHDFQCGAKLFRRAVIERVAADLTIRHWAFDVELLYLSKRNGFKTKEIPTVWHDQAGSKLLVMRSGLRMLSAIVKLRLRHSPFARLIRQYD